MKKPHLASEGAGQNSTGGAKHSLADQPCPNALLCRRWRADGDGVYCRFCWRDFTSPKPLHVAEARAGNALWDARAVAPVK